MSRTSKPRELSKLLRIASNSVERIATKEDADSSAVSASAAAYAQAVAYVDYMMENIDALPNQSTHGGKYLSTDGTSAFWNTSA